MCQEVINHYPQQCNGCGGLLGIENSGQAYRHQVVEVLPVQRSVIEHQLHPIIPIHYEGTLNLC